MSVVVESVSREIRRLHCPSGVTLPVRIAEHLVALMREGFTGQFTLHLVEGRTASAEVKYRIEGIKP